MARCKQSVHHGRMGMFSCMNDALTGSQFCGIHDKAAKAAAREKLTRPPQASGELEQGHTVKVTLTARLSWSNGTGPRAVVPYTEKIVELERVTVSRDVDDRLGDSSRVHVAAVRVKKDGTTGTSDRSENWRWGALPPEVQARLSAALDAEEVAYRGNP